MRRDNKTGRQLREPPGHVTVMSRNGRPGDGGTTDGSADGGTVDVRPTAGEWERMHATLSAWKAQAMLREAVKELRRGLGSGPIDEALAARLTLAEVSASQALSALTGANGNGAGH